MRIMCAQKEEHNGHAKQELFGGRVLGSIINLLPHVQVVVGTSVKLEGNSSNVVEHDV